MKKTTRIVCLALAAVFVLSLLCSVVISVALGEGDAPSARGETVYITADANGNVERVIVSVYLSNAGRHATLTDYTRLAAIEPVTINDPPVIDGEAATFAAKGEDVSYQGEAAGEDLPFSVRITYYLDGKETAPEAIAGQSGRVRIEVKAENYLKETVEVDGEPVELYVPFSVVGMMTLPESFSGVSAENAKLTSQAGQTTVMAVLLPGLAESLSTEKGDRLNDTFAVEATVENFSFDGATFIGMTGIVDQNDLSGIEDVQALTDALSELNDAAAELHNGARKLRNAMGTYEEGIVAYAEGVAEAALGSGDIADGISELSGGAGKLAEGSGEITAGLKALSQELAAAGENFDAAAGGISGEAIAAVVEQLAVGIAKEATAAALASVSGGELPPEFAAVVDNISLSPEAKAQLSAQIGAMMNQGGGAADLTAMLSEIASAVEQLADGSDELTDGAYELAEGAEELSDGLAEFSEGMYTMLDGGYELVDGAHSIRDGLSEIASGLSALANEGLQEIVDETSEIDVSLSRKDALVALSESYTSFSATRAPEDGDVQFMLTTEGIEEELPIVPEEMAGTGEGAGDTAAPSGAEKGEQGVFQRIGAWFSDVFAAIGSWFR